MAVHRKTGYRFVSGEVQVRCRNKARFPNRHQAALALKDIVVLHGDSGLQPYLCPYCAQWHLGHPTA
jgi:hypothetical protein